MKASGPPRLSLPDFDISPERGFLDEEWFVLVHIEIEAEAGPGLIGLVQAQNAAEDDKEDDVLIGLRMLAAAQEAMRETLLRMPERCDPYIYYSRVRSYIHGWKNSPALPEGVMYEGVASYQENRSYFGEKRAHRVPLCRLLMRDWESGMPTIRSHSISMKCGTICRRATGVLWPHWKNG